MQKQDVHSKSQSDTIYTGTPYGRFFFHVIAGVAISMDGKGRWMDNVFIERLWRLVKWECVYLREFETGSQARQALGDWFRFYNEQRPYTAFDGP